MSEFLGSPNADPNADPIADRVAAIMRALSRQSASHAESEDGPAEAIAALRRDHDAIEEAELAAVFQQLQAEGIDFQRHPAVISFYHGHLTEMLATAKINSYPAGHPARTFLEENRLLQTWLTAAESCLLAQDLSGFAAVLDKIATVDIHYVRKENQLFPLLEKHGWVNPSKFMWAFQDDNRVLLKQTRAAVEAGDTAGVARHFAQLAPELRRMIAVEETRLLPNAMKLISDEDWQEMRRGDDEIGWMLASPPAAYPPAAYPPAPALATSAASHEEAAAPRVPEAGVPEAGVPEAGVPEVGTRAAQSGEANETTANTIVFNQPPTRRKDLPFATDDKLYFGEGYLTPEQINLIFRFLPVDLTYVDENDRVLFYNRGEDRVFSRSAGVIGREVRFCHPPKSVDTVLRIVEEFRNGTKDVADFWIKMRGRMIHIRYFAVRDEAKNYRGVLEMTQDITEIRSLEGQQRLLDW